MNKKIIYWIVLCLIAIIASIYFRYSPAELPETTAIKIYFSNIKFDPEVSCDKVFPVMRTVTKTAAIGKAAIEELLKGPTAQERADGFSTSINSGVMLQSLAIENKTADADFNDQLQYQVGGSCKVTAIRAQITETLKQFPTIERVVISINGRIEDILQP